MTVILNMLAGAGIGAGGAIVIYILSNCFNWVCHYLACNFEFNDDAINVITPSGAVPAIWEDDSINHMAALCIAAGAVIGLVYGICKIKAAKKEAARLKNAENLEETRIQYMKWADFCDKKEKEYKPLIIPEYEADAQMDSIINELANASELKGKVDAIANDTKTKGGVSK